MALCIIAEMRPYRLDELFSGHLHGKILTTTSSLIEATIWFGLPLVILTGLLCSAVWWGLGVVRRQSTLAAAVVGFLVTFTVYFFSLGGGKLESVGDASLFGTLGLVSGLVTRSVSGRLWPSDFELPTRART